MTTKILPNHHTFEMEGTSSKRARTQYENVEVGVFAENKSEDSKGGENQRLLVPIGEPMLLPENWKLILDNLSPPDFLSAINTCQVWSDLMHHKKTTSLFPLATTFLINYLPIKDTLSLRGVNHLLKNAVDTLFQEVGLPEREFEFENVPISRALLNLTSAGHRRLNSVAQVRKLLTRTEHWLSPLGNPFLSGVIGIKMQNYYHPRYPEHLSLKTLLERFGHQIVGLSLELPNELEEELLIPTLISILSMNLPNLKKLHFNGLFLNHLMKSLVQSRYEFPPLQKLTTVDSMYLEVVRVLNTMELTDVWAHLPFIQKYGTQFTSFKGSSVFFEAVEVDTSLLNTQLPNIRCLFAMVGLQGLEKLSKVNWSLEKMNLDASLSFWRHGKKNVFVKVLRAINNFSGSLTHLYIDFEEYEKELRTPKKMGLEQKELKALPKLKVLKTSVPEGKPERLLEFLGTSCPNLELLQLVVENGMDEPLVKMVFEKVRKLRKIQFLGRNGERVATVYRGATGNTSV